MGETDPLQGGLRVCRGPTEPSCGLGEQRSRGPDRIDVGVDRLKDRLDVARGRSAGAPHARMYRPAKDSNRALTVRDGAEKGLQANLEALIHRDQKLIARVRISRVKDNIAIADILPDWNIEQVALGDEIMFDID